MAKLTINVGATANDRQGDSLRGAFQKINANFSELYTALGLNSDTTLNLGAFQFTGSVMDTTDSSAITIDQAVTVSSNLTVGGDILPSSDFGANLGSSTNRFKDLFLSGNTIKLGNQTIGATSTGISTSGNLSIGDVTISAVGNSLNIPGISELRFKPADLEDLRSLNGASFFNSDTTVANSVIVDRLTYLIATDATYAPLKSVGYIPSSYIATFDGGGNITAVAINIPRFYPEEPGFTTLETINTDLIALDPDTDINDWDSIASSGQAVTLYVGINSESQPYSPAAASLSFYDLTITPTTLAGYGITDAFDGAYSSLSGAPEIPTDVGELTDIGGLLSGGDGVVEGSTYKIDIAGDDSTLLVDSTKSKIVGYVENDRFNVDGNDYQVRIGVGAGATTQGTDAIAIGEGAGNYQQGTRSIAIGRGSGNADQGLSAVGIGFCAGGAEQGDYAIAIGFKAGRGPMAGDPDPAQPNNSIIINASGDKLNGTNSGLYIDPVREDTGNIAKAVYYNTTTKELTYANPTGAGDGANLVSENDINITINSPDSTTYTWNFNELGRIEIPDVNNQVAGYIGDIYETGGLTLQSVPGGYVELTTGDENVGFWVQETTPGSDPLINPEASLYTTGGEWSFYQDGRTAFPGSIDLGGAALKKSSTLEERTGGVGSAPGNVAVLDKYRHMSLNNQLGTVITGNFTVNFTSVDLPSDYIARFSVLIRQGSTGYYPNVLQINGVTQTLLWEGGTTPTPTSSAGAVDLFEFILYSGGNVAGTATGRAILSSSSGGGGEFATIGTGNLYSANLTNFANTYTSGTYNFLAGTSAGNSLTSGNNNIAIGKSAGAALTTGIRNIAIGELALSASTNTGENIAIGRYANGFSTAGELNVAIGSGALGSNTGDYNVAIGHATQGAGSVVSGTEQVLVGYQAGYSNAGATNYNTFVGAKSGYSNGSGKSNNTYVGHSAGYYFSGASNTTIVGTAAGGADGVNQATGSNNTVIGYQAAISAYTVSDEITLGNSSITTLRCNTQSITSLSDARDKKDVEDLSLGLNFVERLRPVAFTWNMRDGGKVDQPDTGFIAQELQQAQDDEGQVLPGLVYTTNPEKLEASYGKLIPSLVKSIQELSSQVKELQQQIKDIKGD